MTKTTKLSRRALAGGAFALAALPAAAAQPAPSPIARLWAEAETLRVKLAGHRAAIAEAAAKAGDGLPGWMRLGGEANRIAELHYGKLVATLNAEPKNAGDLAILAKVSTDPDIAAGPRIWASERLTQAAVKLA